MVRGEGWDPVSDTKGETVADLIPVERETLRAIFDLAVNSLNFGSGFWDSEETNAARAIAGLIGVDPMEATPPDLRKHYAHAWKAQERVDFSSWWTEVDIRAYNAKCDWCGKAADAAIHVAVADGEPS